MHKWVDLKDYSTNSKKFGFAHDKELQIFLPYTFAWQRNYPSRAGMHMFFVFYSLIFKHILVDWCYQSEFTCSHTCTGKPQDKPLSLTLWIKEGKILHGDTFSTFCFAGPEVWEGVSYNCGGRFQSPVNIVTKKNQLDECLTPFHFSGYQDTFYGRLLNNGHSGAFLWYFLICLIRFENDESMCFWVGSTEVNWL